MNLRRQVGGNDWGSGSICPGAATAGAMRRNYVPLGLQPGRSGDPALKTPRPLSGSNVKSSNAVWAARVRRPGPASGTAVLAIQNEPTRTQRPCVPRR